MCHMLYDIISSRIFYFFSCIMWLVTMLSDVTCCITTWSHHSNPNSSSKNRIKKDKSKIKIKMQKENRKRQSLLLVILIFGTNKWLGFLYLISTPLKLRVWLFFLTKGQCYLLVEDGKRVRVNRKGPVLDSLRKGIEF